jgi:pimeloyl-ACP methyl ester carboxylesterase
MIVKIKEQTVHYTVYGHGLPLIILHGFYLDSVSMVRAIEDTKISLKGFKRIYVDMPGMGQSPKHQLNNNSDTMLDLMCEFIKAIVHNHPFIVMGYSYGGYIVQGIAKRFLKQIIGEVLICPVVIPQIENRRKAKIINQDIDQEFLSLLDEKKQKDLLEKMVVINKRTYMRHESDFYRAHALADNVFLEELYQSDNYVSQYIESNEGFYPHKTLIFLGYQDIVVGYLDMLERLQYYPKATVNLLSDASHSFFLEQPTQFEYILNSWLSQYKS